MNVLVLEHPRLESKPHFNDIANTPLWSCVMAGYVYSALKTEGVEVSFLDANAEGLNFSQTISAIRKYKPDLLTINTVYFWEHTSLLFAMLADLRRQNFTGHINLFGFFPTLHHGRLIADPSVDSIASGECEVTIVELAGNLTQPQNIAGLITKDHPLTPRKQIADLDSIAFPHRTPTQLTQPVSILASRGCYNHCSFCPIPSFYNNGPLWRGRSIANIMAEITRHAEQGIQDFYFVDPNFIGPGQAGRQRILDLLSRLQPLDIRFGMETRAGDLDDELMEHLVQGGLTSLLMGVESGSSSRLQDFGKNETVHESERGIGICRRGGIEPEIGFLMFTPDSTPQSLAENMEFLQRNNLLDRLDRTANLLCHQQIIMASTTGFQQYNDRGLLQEDDPLGFIGKVEFQNAQVKKTAETVIPLCHFILQQTGMQDSPLYFRGAGNYEQFTELNDLLVAEISRHIKQPATADLHHSLQRLEQILKQPLATHIPSSRA